MESFPLLRLPAVALTVVLQKLELTELFLLTFLSSKSLQCIRLAYIKHHLMEMNVNFTQQVVQLEMNSSKFEIIISADPLVNGKLIQIDGATVEIQFVKIQDDFDILLHWKEGIAFVKHVVDYIIKVFRCNIISVTVPFHNQEFEDVSNWLLKKQNTIERLTITKGDCDERKFAEVLQKLQVIKELNITNPFSSSFSYTFEGRRWPKMIFISESQWFTLDHLLACDSERIELHNSLLTNQNLDTYLRKWHLGETPFLSYLEIRSKRFGIEMIMGNVPPLSDIHRHRAVVTVLNRTNMIEQGAELKAKGRHKSAIMKMILGSSVGRFQMIVEY